MLPLTASLAATLLSQAPAPPPSANDVCERRLQTSSANVVCVRRLRTSSDSARLLRNARDAQLGFEFIRRRDLTRDDQKQTRWEQTRCNFSVGRFCYYRDEDDDYLPPPPEPLSTLRARRLLLIQLAAIAETIPGDNWILGQRVRYLVEDHRADSAVALARRCDAAADWCAALAGFALHVMGNYEAADSAYTIALAGMPEQKRCRWSDLSMILDDALKARYAHLDCAGRLAYARKLTRLAAPLYTISRTDLWTEHLARQTYSAISENAATTEGIPWYNDMHELTIRYGWMTWFTKDPFATSEDGPLVTGHQRGTPLYFYPPATVVDDPATSQASDWDDDDPRAPSGYAPVYARSVHQLPHQVARFRRGDSALVVVAWNARQEGTLRGTPLDVSLAIANDSQAVFVRRPPADSNANIAGVLQAEAPWGSIASLEVLARADRRAGRVRVGVPALTKGEPSVSDLLLYRPTAGVTPQRLADVTDSSMTDDVVRHNRPLGVFWETYTTRSAPEPVTVSITVDEIGLGMVARAADRLHLSSGRSSLRIEYQDRLGPEPLLARGVQLDLSALRPGRYRIRLEVAPRSGTPSFATREVRVE